MTKKKHFRIGPSDESLPGSHKIQCVFANGKKRSEGLLLDGQPHGEWKYYRLNGDLWQIGFFDKGKKHGRWIRINDRGQIIADRIYLHNKPVSR